MYIFAAGGTGGHVFPAISVSHELIDSTLFITDQRGERYFSDEDHVETLLLRRDKHYVLDMIKAVIKCLSIFKKYKPLGVMGFGGYPSVPACLAAFLLRIPFALHEQNAKIGKANQLLSFFTPYLFTSFPSIKGQHVGNPIRKNILSLFEKAYQPPNHIINCLIIGGSQGSKELSYLVPNALPPFVKVHHQARPEDIDYVVDLYKKRSIDAVVKPFFEDMAFEYEWSHFVISRSGASTLSELMIAKRPAILIPFEKGGQKENAESVKDLFMICHNETELKQSIMTIVQSLQEKSDLIANHAKPYAAKDLASFLIKTFHAQKL